MTIGTGNAPMIRSVSFILSRTVMKLNKDNNMRPFLIILMLTVVFFPNAGQANPGTTVEADGVFTYTQTINRYSEAPYYTAPTNGGGFGIYSWYNQDYGWQHDFPAWNTADINIISAKMTISAWDVDSEPWHGTEGEYDGLEVDNTALDPGLLQGENARTSITNFDIPLSSITDDGKINVFLDIDMNHTSYYWATRLDSSTLEIVYTIVEANTPPTIDSLSIDPAPTATDNDDLKAIVAYSDNEGDTVTIGYRWYVDVGQGFYVDDEFAGRNNHVGDTVPADDTEPGDKWKVEVIPEDSNGAIGNETTAETTIELTFFNYYPSATTYNTLVFEDLWPELGDHDMNDLVVWYRLMTASDSAGRVKMITFTGQVAARGAGYGDSFGLSFNGIDETMVDATSLTIGGSPVAGFGPETGHSGELVFILFDDARDILHNETTEHSFYNTEPGDLRPTIPITLTFSLNPPQDMGSLNTYFFNPFIIKDRVNEGRGTEIHLRDHPPTDLADTSQFGTKDDASNLAEKKFYRSKRNMPWALNIASKWYHPLEQTNLVKAYPDLEKWVESNGTQNTDWYLNPVDNQVWPEP